MTPAIAAARSVTTCPANCSIFCCMLFGLCILTSCHQRVWLFIGHSKARQRSPREGGKRTLHFPQLGLLGYDGGVAANGLNHWVVQVSLGRLTVGKKIHAAHLELLFPRNPNLPDQPFCRGNDGSGFSALPKQNMWRHP